MKFNKEVWIENKLISEVSPVFIIAEAGVNHNGDISLAKKLIDIATHAGVDAVKFQAFKTDELILSNVEKAPYQKRTTGKDQSQYKMLKKLEITQQQNVELQNYCKKNGVIFLTTPFDSMSLQGIEPLDLPAYKVASTDTTNVLFLEQIAKKNKPILLSTGMTFFSEVIQAVNTIVKFNKDLILLQCTANYPTADNEANLKVISTFQKEFDLLVGYSDHTSGIGAAPYAVAMGAKVIEKHFTIDQDLSGPDHKASLSPKELAEFVKIVRQAESFLGSAIKMPTLSEQQTRKSLQKSIVAANPIKKGAAIREADITTKRAGGEGISALYAKCVVGAKAKKNFNRNDLITL